MPILQNMCHPFILFKLLICSKKPESNAQISAPV